MTRCRQKDIALVDFGFSEGTGSKKRPVLIISSDNYHRNRKEVIAAAITSNIGRILFADTRMADWKDAGLLYPSLVTGVIRTIKENMVIRKLGSISQKDFLMVQENLKKAMGF